MYGPPPNYKKNRRDENSLRKCIRPLREYSPGAWWWFARAGP